MKHILHIDTSPRSARSISRSLTEEFIRIWKQVHPDDVITYRDLGHYIVPPIDEAWIAAAFSRSDTLSQEFLCSAKNIQ